MSVDKIFRLQCQAMHTRRSIASLANDLPFDPKEMSVAVFIELLDEVSNARPQTDAFKADLGFAPE